MNKSMQKFDQKKAILVVLAVISVFIWYSSLKPFFRKKSDILPAAPPLAGSLEQRRGQRKRSTYKNWGRTPFIITKTPVSDSSRLSIGGIVYDEKDICALINDQVVHVGDQVNENRVVDIRRDRVILNDGKKDFELKLE